MVDGDRLEPTLVYYQDLKGTPYESRPLDYYRDQATQRGWGATTAGPEQVILKPSNLNGATVTVNRNVDFGPSSQVQLLGHVTHNFCKDA